MGALAAVCTPTLKSAGKKHQNSAPPYRNTVDGALKVVKGTVYYVYFLLLANNLSLVSEQATRVYSGKICQKFQLLKMVAAPFKIVFDEDLYVVFHEDIYVLSMYLCFALSMS